MDYALEELKKQAAKIGANGIIIENIGKSTSANILMNNVMVPITAQNISGKAIYVEK